MELSALKTSNSFSHVAIPSLRFIYFIEQYTQPHVAQRKWEADATFVSAYRKPLYKSFKRFRPAGNSKKGSWNVNITQNMNWPPR